MELAKFAQLDPLLLLMAMLAQLARLTKFSSTANAPANKDMPTTQLRSALTVLLFPMAS